MNKKIRVSKMHWKNEEKRIKETMKDFLNDKEYIKEVKKALDYLAKH